MTGPPILPLERGPCDRFPSSSARIRRSVAAGMAACTLTGLVLVVLYRDFPVFDLAILALTAWSIDTLRFAWNLWRDTGPQPELVLRSDRRSRGFIGVFVLVGAAAAAVGDIRTSGLTSTGMFLVLLPQAVAAAYRGKGNRRWE